MRLPRKHNKSEDRAAASSVARATANQSAQIKIDSTPLDHYSNANQSALQRKMQHGLASKVPTSCSSRSNVVQKVAVTIDSEVSRDIAAFISTHPVVAWFKERETGPALYVKMADLGASTHGKTDTNPNGIDIYLNPKVPAPGNKGLGQLMETFTHEVTLHAKPFAEQLALVRSAYGAPSGKESRTRESSILKSAAVQEHLPLLDPYPQALQSENSAAVSYRQRHIELARDWTTSVKNTLTQILAAKGKEVAEAYLTEVQTDMDSHSTGAFASRANVPAQQRLMQELLAIVASHKEK